jgi:hypothetical protein
MVSDRGGMARGWHFIEAGVATHMFPRISAREVSFCFNSTLKIKTDVILDAEVGRMRAVASNLCRNVYTIVDVDEDVVGLWDNENSRRRSLVPACHGT